MSACVRVCTHSGVRLHDASRPEVQLRVRYSACVCVRVCLKACDDRHEAPEGREMSGFWTGKFVFWGTKMRIS